MWLSCALAISALALSGDGAYHDPTPEERAVLDRYRSAVKKLDETYKHVSGTGVLVERYKPEGSQKSAEERAHAYEKRKKIDFSRSGSHMLMMTKWFDDKVGDFGRHYQSVFGLNDAYAFVLQRNRPGSTPEYSIKNLGKIDRIENSFRYYCFWFLDSVRGTVYDTSFNIFNYKNLKIKNIQNIVYGGLDCYKISYQHSTTPENDLFDSGWIVVSPDEGWIVKEYLCQAVDWTSSLYGKITYAPPSTGNIPTPTEVVLKQGDLTRTLTLTNLNFAASDPSKYQVSNFGLPESVASPKTTGSTNATFTWFSLAFACLVASITLSRLFGKQVRTSQTAPPNELAPAS